MTPTDITLQIHQYLTTAPSSHFLGQVVEMVDAWEGSENLLWRVNCHGQTSVVKLYLDAGQARGRRQYDAHERYAPLGLAPRPRWFDRYPEGLSRQVLVYEWAAGEPLALTDRRQTIALAASVAQVHNADPAAVRRFCPNPINLDYFWRILRGSLASTRQWLAQSTDVTLSALFAQLTTQAEGLVQAALPLWQGAQPTPVHGDLRPENILYSVDAAVLLDWELFGLGDPALDVARLLQQSRSQFDQTEQAVWLAHYLPLLAQPRLGERIIVYGQLLPLQAACFLLHGLRHHSQRPDLDLALEDALPFLSVATGAALGQAAAALHVVTDNAKLEAAVHQLFVRT